MKTELIFFDSLRNSGYLGTMRGFFAFVVIMSMMIPVILITKKYSIHSVWSTLLGALVLCSAIGVQLPSSYKEVVAYSGLIGLAISVFCICTDVFYRGYSSHKMWLLVPYVCTVSILSALFTRYISQKYGFYK